MPAGERLDVRHPRARLIVEELPEPGQALRLPPEEAAHARARRLSPGETVVLFDGSGSEAVAQVLSAARTGVVLRVLELRRPEREAAPIALFVAGLRAERLAWLVEKATELGAQRVGVVATERTQRFRAAPGLQPRLERIARESAKQCGRADWPAVSGPEPLGRVLAAELPGERLFLDHEGEPFPEKLDRGGAALVVGPEGGWSESERREAAARGWRITRLPAGKLRGETAAIAALVLARAALPGFR